MKKKGCVFFVFRNFGEGKIARILQNTQVNTVSLWKKRNIRISFYTQCNSRFICHFDLFCIGLILSEDSYMNFQFSLTQAPVIFFSEKFRR